MRSLELSNFSVVEMDAKQMRKTVGGGVWDFIVGYVGGKLVELAINDFKSRDGSKART